MGRAGVTRQRRTRVLLSGFAAALVLPGAGLAAVHLTHPRDTTAYLGYLEEYKTGSYAISPDGIVGTLDEAGDVVPFQHSHPTPETLIAAGDRACDWLSRQPYAGVRTGDQFRVSALGRRFQADRRASAVPWPGVPDDSLVQAGAWTHLCPATLWLHKPHWVFERPPD